MLNESCEVYEKYANTPSQIASEIYFYAEWAGYFVCNPDFFIERENNGSILILYTVGGCGTLEYRGKIYELTPNTIALINCIDPHTYYPSGDEKWSFYYVHFSGSESFKMYEYIYSLDESAKFEGNNILFKYVTDIISHCKTRTVAFETKISKRICGIVYEMILTRQQKEKSGIDTICEYINENYAEEISVEKLADMLNYSRCHFSVKFKQLMGMTPHEYVKKRRIDRAKELLIEDNTSIEKIAELIGYNDACSFIRAFKSTENITPLQFKKRYFCR